MKVSLFVACYNDTLFPETGIAVTRILERLGHTVEFPTEQTCCGQMHYNTGYQAETVPLVRRFVSIFRDAEAVCVPSASCVAMMREHYELIAAQEYDSDLLAEIRILLPRIFEFSELLVHRLGIEDVGAVFPHTVTYHPSCHSLRMLNVGDAPVRLLRKVSGLELIGLPSQEQCCGFGGKLRHRRGRLHLHCRVRGQRSHVRYTAGCSYQLDRHRKSDSYLSGS